MTKIMGLDFATCSKTIITPLEQCGYIVPDVTNLADNIAKMVEEKYRSTIKEHEQLKTKLIEENKQLRAKLLEENNHLRAELRTEKEKNKQLEESICNRKKHMLGLIEDNEYLQSCAENNKKLLKLF